MRELQETFMGYIRRGDLIDVQWLPSEEKPGVEEMVLTFSNKRELRISRVAEIAQKTANDLFSLNPRNVSNPNHIYVPDAMGYTAVRLWPRHKEAKKLADSLIEAINKKTLESPFHAAERFKSRLTNQQLEMLEDIMPDRSEAYRLQERIEELQERLIEKYPPFAKQGVSRRLEDIREGLSYLIAYKANARPKHLALINDIEDFCASVGRHYQLSKPSEKGAAVGGRSL